MTDFTRSYDIQLDQSSIGIHEVSYVGINSNSSAASQRGSHRLCRCCRCCHHWRCRRWLDELRAALRLHAPAAAAGLLRVGPQAACLLACGHLSSIELAAAGVSWPLLVGLGLAPALSVGAAYGPGAGAIVLTLAGCLLANARPLLLGLGVAPLLAAMSANLLLALLPGAVFACSFVWLSRARRRFSNGGCASAPFLSASLGNAACIGALLYGLTRPQLGMRYLGIGLCYSAAQAVSLMSIAAAAGLEAALSGRHRGRQSPFFGDSRIPGRRRRALPGVAAGVLEGVVFHAAPALVAGATDPTGGLAAAQGVTWQLVLLIRAVAPLASSMSLGIRISRQLDRRDAPSARRSFGAGLALALAFGALFGALPLALLRWPIARLLCPCSSDSAAGLLGLAAPLPLAESLALPCAAALAAAGHPSAASGLVALALAGVALPLGFCLAFAAPPELGPAGCWLGQLGGAAVAVGLLSSALRRLAWRFGQAGEGDESLDERATLLGHWGSGGGGGGGNGVIRVDLLAPGSATVTARPTPLRPCLMLPSESVHAQPYSAMTSSWSFCCRIGVCLLLLLALTAAAVLRLRQADYLPPVANFSLPLPGSGC